MVFRANRIESVVERFSFRARNYSPVPRYLAVQRFRAAVHQFHQREVATVLQSSHVRARARGIQEGGNCLAVH